MSALVVEGVTGRAGTDQPVVVIGAGPAGLAAAEHLLDVGAQVVVVDAAPGVGGPSRSIELWGHRFDLGPHGFRADAHPESVTRWLDLAGAVGGVERTRARRSAVWRGRVVGFPPRPAEVLRTVGAGATARTAGARLAAKLNRREPRTPVNAHQALLAHHGRAVVEELFVPYARKYLGAHPGDLSPASADELQGTRRGGDGPVELLTPREGTGAVWDELARRLRARGARILLGTTVTGLSATDGRITAVRVRDNAAEFSIATRAVVSTVPAPVLLQWLPGTTAPTGPSPRHRDTYLVHLLLDGEVGQDSHDVTAYDESLRVGRLTNTRVWRPATFRDEPRTVLRAEFWSSGDDDLSARTDHELAQLAVAELPAFGVDRGVRVLDHDVLRLPRSVPVPTRGVEAARAELDVQLDALTNLARVGRHGRHDGDGQEDALLTGRSIGAHLLTTTA